MLTLFPVSLSLAAVASTILIIGARAKIRCLSERPRCSACLRRGTVCGYESSAERRTVAGGRDPIQGVLETGMSSTTTTPVQDLQETVSRSSECAAQPTTEAQIAASYSHAPPYNVQTNLDSGENPSWSSPLCLDWDLMNSSSDLRWIFNDAIFGAPLVDYNLTDLPGTASLTDPVASAMGEAPSLETPEPRRSGPTLQDKLTALVAPGSLDSSTSGGVWPILWKPEAGKSHFVLPPLREKHSTPTIQRRFFQLTPVTDVTRTALANALKLPFEHVVSKTVNLENWPESSKLDYCIDQYFAYFHPMVSIIHQATFDPQEELLVTLAVITVGSAYTGIQGAHAFQVALCELLRRLLVFVREHDPRLARTEPYLTAQLLQGMMGYAVGDEALFDFSEANRCSIIYNAKCMGLFSNEVSSLDSTTQLDSLQNEWRTWIRQERRCRLGWAVFEFDASASYLHNAQPRLNSADLIIPLPSSIDAWQAESAHSWASSHSRSEEQNKLNSLPLLIKRLYERSENANATIQDIKHRFLVLLTLMTKLWDVRGFDWSTPPASAAASLQGPRQYILEGIDRFHQSPANAARSHTSVEMIHIVHQAKLVHMAHLIAAGDLMGLLYPFLRNGMHSNRAGARMMDWATEDLERYRRVIFSSAQILSLLRQYPSNMPSEPFLIFHAGIILSCMAQIPQDGVDLGSGRAMRVDKLFDPEHKTEISDWIAHGGSGVALHGVPWLCCGEGRRQILDQTAELLKRRTIWRVSQSLVRVVIALRDENRNLQNRPVIPDYHRQISLSPT